MQHSSLHYQQYGFVLRFSLLIKASDESLARAEKTHPRSLESRF